MKTLLLLALAACASAPPTEYHPAPQFHGDVTTDCGNSCANLRRLGCHEGYGAISGETCERRCAIALELRSLPLQCWTAADDVVAAVSCGSLRCAH